MPLHSMDVDVDRGAKFPWLACLIVAVGIGSGCAGSKPVAPTPKAKQEAERLANQAATLQANGNWNGALAWWDRAAQQYALLHDRTNLAVAYHNLGMVRRSLGRMEEASADLEKAAHLNEQTGKREAWWRNQIGRVQVANDAGSAGAPALLSRLDGEPDRPTTGRLAAVLGHERARARFSSGDGAGALAEAERAVSLYLQADDLAGTAATGVLCGRILRNLGRNEEAIVFWRESLSMFERLGDPRGITVSLAGWGGSLAATGRDKRLAHEILKHAEVSYRILGHLAEAEEVARERDALVPAEER